MLVTLKKHKFNRSWSIEFMNSDNQLCSTHRFKCHHSLEIHDGAVTKSMVHAFIYPKINQESIKSSHQSAKKIKKTSQRLHTEW